MKKTVCCLLLVVLCLSLCGCGITMSSAQYPDADKYLVGSFTYHAGAVEAVEINWTSGRVEFKESDQAELTVTETTEGLKEEEQMRWWLDGKTLRIQYWKSGYSGTLVNKEKRVIVELPRDISLKAHVTSGAIQAGDHRLLDAALEATSGSIQVGALNAGEAKISMTSGSVQTGPVRVEKQFSVSATSGDITLENVMANSVSLQCTSGKIKAGPIDAPMFKIESTSGDVRLDALKADNAAIQTTSGEITLGIYQCGKADVTSTSGDVDLTLLHGSGATVDFRTNSGRFNGKKDDTKRYHEVIGDGAAIVTVSTTSGDLKLKEK